MIKSFLLSTLLSVQASAAIYGFDTRQPVLANKSSSSLAQPQRAVGMLIPNTDILPAKSNPALRDFSTDTLEKNQYMCSSERFSNQQSFFVSCTGFLVAPDILVTAGHCAVNYGEAENEATPLCTDFSWYFDFEAEASGNVKTTDIDPTNIYECETVLKAAHITKPLGNNQWDFDDDYAVIKLKKAVTGRQPLVLSANRPKANEVVSMIGHPLGSIKISTYGRILSNEPKYERSTVGGFPGNSGSPVFNSKKEVVGILVRGYPESLIDDKKRDCTVVNRCTATASKCTVDDKYGIPAGDHIMPIANIELLKKMGLAK